MKYKYIALHPDEDGNCITFLDEEKLRQMLEEEYWGRVNFLSEKDLEEKGLDPQSWSYDRAPTDILLMTIGKIIIPKPVAYKWEIDDR